MFEQYIYWYFENCLGSFSKKNRKMLYEQHKYWYVLFVVINAVIALITTTFGIAVMYYFICLQINVVQIILIATIICVIEVRVINFINKKFRVGIINKVYPLIVTKRGKAISKKDFKKLRNIPGVYNLIMSKACVGYCFFTSWTLLNALHKGYIQFVAVQEFNKCDVIKKEKHILHVLYVNNNWCYDTNTQRQIPIEEFYRIFNGKPIAKYEYTDIASKSYEEFYESIKPILKKWCKKNDCGYFAER